MISPVLILFPFHFNSAYSLSSLLDYSLFNRDGRFSLLRRELLRLRPGLVSLAGLAVLKNHHFPSRHQSLKQLTKRTEE